VTARGQGRPRRAGRVAAAAGRHVPSLMPLVAAGLVVALGAFAWWWFAARDRRPSPPSAVEPGAGLGGQQAHERGLALARSGDPLAAAAYFRRVVALYPGSWFAHENLAGALGNGAQQARVHLGKVENATRSSVERVAMMRETLDQTETAERLTGAAPDRAVVLFERGRALQTWGFPCEALELFRSAAAADPARTDIAESVRRAERSLASGGRSVE